MSDSDSFYSIESESSFVSFDDQINYSVSSLSSQLNSIFHSCDKTLNVCHINAQSIPSHFSELEVSFSNNNIHAILVSETWLKPSLHSALYPLPGFVLIRNDRIDKGGGGVAIYLHASISYKIILASPSPYAASAEFLFIEIDLKGSRMILGAVYCPPSTDYFADLEVALDKIGSEYAHCIIMGDFNTDLLKNSIRSQMLRTIIESVNLNILPLKATHHNIGTDDSLIDLIIADSSDRVLSYGQLEAPGFSRHDLIYVSYNLKPPKYRPTVLFLRNFSRINTDKLMKDASLIDFMPLATASTVDEKVTIFNNIIQVLYDNHAPVRRVKLKRPPAPWMTEEVRKAMSRRNRAFARFKRRRSEENWLTFKMARNRCNQMVRSAKRRFIHSNISNSSPADVWKFLKSLGVGKTPSLDCGSSLSHDALNLHFASASALDLSIRSQTVAYIASIPSPHIPVFLFNPVDQDEIRKTLLAIKSKAVGCDDISRVMITNILEYLLPAVTHIVNFSLDSGQFPSQWKKAFVRPLPKVSNPTLPNHFRPISVLPFLSKVLEACVHKQISNFIYKHNLLSTFQSGFRPGHSTTTALLKITEDIREGMENKKVTVVVLVDFSNAFNTVDHDILLAILSYFRFAPSVLEWFSSYLRGRQQSVHVEQMTSQWVDLISGVPQGGILSPLIFSIFINSITSNIDCSYHLYADDLQIYVQSDICNIHNAIDKLNSNLKSVHEWSMRFGVSVNPTKCQAVILGSSRMLAKIDAASLPSVYYNDRVIPFSSSVKNLGLHIDSTLTWGVHISETCRKVSGALRSLYRLKNFLPFKTKIMLVQLLIIPIIDYADVCYPDLNQNLLNKLERLLNNCIRYIFSLRKYDHISCYRSRLKWLTIKQRRDSRILLVLFSILNDPSTPSYLKDKFQYISSTHDRTLRSSYNNKLSIPQHFTNFVGKSFTIQAALLWNSLPDDVRKMSNKSTFKRLVHKHFMKMSDGS